jgi:RNA polymerase sigma factor for flagellar operon FliA
MSATATVLPAPATSAVETATTDELVRTHLPLVGHLVRELAGRLPSHVNRDDLTSAGMMALVTSAQGFDDSRGVPFARFATIRIRGALTDELRSMDWASRGVRSRARDVDATKSELTAALGRTPSRVEVAQTMGVGVAELDALEADVHRAATLSVEGLTETAGGDLIPSPDNGPEGLLVQREQIGLLHDAIAELPERLRVVIEAYFYGNQRMADIAADLGVTESRISQLRTEALAMLRDGLMGQNPTGAPTIPEQRRPARSGSAAPSDRRGSAVTAQLDTAAEKPSRREVARQAYIAAIASRSTLAGRLAVTTTLGETRTGTLQTLRAAQ